MESSRVAHNPPLHGGEERVKNTSKGGDWAKGNKGKAEAAFTFSDHCSSAEPIQVCGAMVVAAIATRLRATPRTHSGAPQIIRAIIAVASELLLVLDAGAYPSHRIAYACIRPLCFVIGAGPFPRPGILATGIADDSEDSIEIISIFLFSNSVIANVYSTINHMFTGLLNF